MLKQFKDYNTCSDMFRLRRNHHQGAVLCLAKTTKYGFSVLVGIDAVNVMAAYQPVVHQFGASCIFLMLLLSLRDEMIL